MNKFNMIHIRQAQDSDIRHLERPIEALQDYLVGVDPLKRLRRLAGYGEAYISELLQHVERKRGNIVIAEVDGVVAGLIAGIIEEQTEADLLECVPSKDGRVLDLIVLDQFRGQQVGAKLMNALEEYFKGQGCTVIRVEVFESNNSAYGFYEHQGYRDRLIDMIKMIDGEAKNNVT